MSYNIKSGESFPFYKEVFSKNFRDLDGDSPCEVVLVSITDASKGELYYDGKKATVGMCFPLGKSNLLSFLRLTNNAIQESFKFRVSDNNQNKQYSKMATVTINIGAYVNQPPSQVGDLSVIMAHATTKVFSLADFTTNLVPAYSDPEGDSPSKLKILTLPNSGIIRLNGAAVTLNQEIPFSSISSGLLTYVSDSSNISAINTAFDFSISDTGSGLFTS